MSFFSRSSLYRLKKCKRILRHTFHHLQKKANSLPEETKRQFKRALSDLQTAILAKDRKSATQSAHRVEELSAQHLKKTAFGHVKELVFALGFALIIAVLVRQMWFEFYEIPTGSMRPTFKEQDRLVVSKTDFGVNIPLAADTFYFDPDLVKRNNIAIFTGENMDIPDVDTMYFYLFPGKKQYVKRVIGKPGDLLYFYGGNIYGIDAQGKDISEELQLKMLDKIDHVPFIDFDRKLVLPPSPTNGIYSPVFIYQMNEPIAKLSITPSNQVVGEIALPKEIHSSRAPNPVDYGDLWGIKNYAMVRMLTKEQLKMLTDQDISQLEEAPLYLEIRHSPSLKSARLIRDEMGRLRPGFGLSTSLLPLQEHHLKRIFENLYTARFQVKNGIAFRYGLNAARASKNAFAVRLPNVPDGVYEFYHGKAQKILWQGIAKTLPKEHPIYQCTPATVQLFFNLGIEWDTRFDPQLKYQKLFPSRYAYYRERDFYLLGAPILPGGDPTLDAFERTEFAKKGASTTQNPYQPFVDAGPPLLCDGTLNRDLIEQNGLRIPPRMYLMLGDNYAMSSDSRDFGFVPAQNLRGGPDFIFWPPGERWGEPLQPGYPLVTLPRVIVWALAALGIGLGSIYWKRRNGLPLPIDSL